MGWRGPCSACRTGLASYLTRPAPRADHQGQTPAIATGFPVTPTSPGNPLGWCPFPTVKVFLLPPPDAAQAFGGQYLRVFHYPQNSSGYPRLNAVIHHRVHSLSTGQGGPAGRGNQRPVPQRFLPPRRLHCRMSDELFVPESFAVPDGLEAGEFRLAPLGRADFRAGAGVPARELGDQRANSASPGPAVPLADENSNPSHAVTPEDPPNVSFCAHTTTLRQKSLIGAYSAGRASGISLRGQTASQRVQRVCVREGHTSSRL
jgi:hypothetical protein